MKNEYDGVQMKTAYIVDTTTKIKIISCGNLQPRISLGYLSL